MKLNGVPIIVLRFYTSSKYLRSTDSEPRLIIMYIQHDENMRSWRKTFVMFPTHRFFESYKNSTRDATIYRYIFKDFEIKNRPV